MLKTLQIKNFLTLSELELEFDADLTVVTGETGVGKSILIDAIALVLGQRANTALIRTGTDKCEISATFDLSPKHAAILWLKEHELTEESNLHIRRIVSKDGQSKIYINGIIAPLNQLQKLGNLLINIHSQHEHQTLLVAGTQRDIVDEIGHHQILRKEVATAFQAWQQAKADLEALQTLAAEQADRTELVRYQVKELDELNLQADEVSTLEQKHRRLNHLEKLTQHIQAAMLLLQENEGASVYEGLYKASNTLQEVSTFDADLNNIIDLLQQSTIFVQEAASSLQNCLDKEQTDPSEIATLNERLDRIHQIARKHRLKTEELMSFHQQLKAELDTLENLEPKLIQQQKIAEDNYSNYRNLAQKLSTARAKTGIEFCNALKPYLKQLGMPYGELKVNLVPYAIGEESAHGLEKVEWLITTNPDHPFKPLNQIVSGGELSRISLAIEALTAAQQTTPTFIFDEVDVGVGGATAETVGSLLKQLGTTKQVLCVTHLAQVAVHGTHHLSVEKKVEKGVTNTRIQLLDPEQRIQEIARMVGGKTLTPQTFEHARKMLETVVS